MTMPGPPQACRRMQPPQQNCAVFCLGTNPPAAVQPQLPPEALPSGRHRTARAGPPDARTWPRPPELAPAAAERCAGRQPAPPLLGPRGAGRPAAGHRR